MSNRGIQRERDVAKLLRDEGWIVGSLRHTFGGGDLIAARRPFDHLMSAYGSVKLIEVKSTAAGPYSHFLPAHRQELLEAAQKAGATAWLYWWPPRGKLHRIGSADWPPVKERTSDG